jgi:hypothetical protein
MKANGANSIKLATNVSHAEGGKLTPLSKPKRQRHAETMHSKAASIGDGEIIMHKS